MYDVDHNAGNDGRRRPVQWWLTLIRGGKWTTKNMNLFRSIVKSHSKRFLESAGPEQWGSSVLLKKTRVPLMGFEITYYRHPSIWVWNHVWQAFIDTGLKSRMTGIHRYRFEITYDRHLSIRVWNHVWQASIDTGLKSRMTGIHRLRVRRTDVCGLLPHRPSKWMNTRGKETRTLS